MKPKSRFMIGALVVTGLIITLLAAGEQGAQATITSCDPCTDGATIFGPETFGREPGVPATGHRNFEMPTDGDACVLLTNDGCGAAEVKIDGVQIFSPGQLSPKVTELVSTIPLEQGGHTLSVRVASAEGCSVTVELRACEAAPLLCSQAATTWCEAKGWYVSYYHDGSVICTAPGYDYGDNCEECGIYNIVVYEDGAGDPLCPGGFCGTYAGHVYGGHDPCECGDNLLYCQPWDMQGCTPDP
jgi:hypothetical protein